MRKRGRRPKPAPKYQSMRWVTPEVDRALQSAGFNLNMSAVNKLVQERPDPTEELRQRLLNEYPDGDAIFRAYQSFWTKVNERNAAK